LPLAEKLPFKMEPYVINGGFAFAILNILAGVGLLFKKSRNIADAKIVSNLDTFIRNSDIYKESNDAQKKIMSLV
jgi:hypothetical protein